MQIKCVCVCERSSISKSKQKTNKKNPRAINPSCVLHTAEGAINVKMIFDGVMCYNILGPCMFQKKIK